MCISKPVLENLFKVGDVKKCFAYPSLDSHHYKLSLTGVQVFFST